MDTAHKNIFPPGLTEQLSGADFQSAIMATCKMLSKPNPIFGVLDGALDAISLPIAECAVMDTRSVISGARIGTEPKPRRFNPSETLRKGLVAILRSFLESRNEEFDEHMINASLKKLTENPGPDVVTDVLRPLYVRKPHTLTDEDLELVAMKLYGTMKPHLRIRNPKRHASNSRSKSSGNSHKGPKTNTMNIQLNGFVRFVSGKKCTGRKQVGIFSLAHNYWLIKESSFVRSAKAHGGKKGYSDYKTLANAYNNLEARRPPIQPLP